MSVVYVSIWLYAFVRNAHICNLMPRVWDEIISIFKGNVTETRERALESECDAMQDCVMYLM